MTSEEAHIVDDVSNELAMALIKLIDLYMDYGNTSSLVCRCEDLTHDFELTIVKIEKERKETH